MSCENVAKVFVGHQARLPRVCAKIALRTARVGSLLWACDVALRHSRLPTRVIRKVIFSSHVCQASQLFNILMRGFPNNIRSTFGVHKLESIDYNPVLIAWRWALLFQHSTLMWQTDSHRTTAYTALCIMRRAVKSSPPLNGFHL